MGNEGNNPNTGSGEPSNYERVEGQVAPVDLNSLDPGERVEVLNRMEAEREGLQMRARPYFMEGAGVLILTSLLLGWQIVYGLSNIPPIVYGLDLVGFVTTVVLWEKAGSLVAKASDILKHEKKLEEPHKKRQSNK